MEQTLTDETATTGQCPATPLAVLRGTRLFFHERRKPFALGGGKPRTVTFRPECSEGFSMSRVP